MKVHEVTTFTPDVARHCSSTAHACYRDAMRNEPKQISASSCMSIAIVGGRCFMIAFRLSLQLLIIDESPKVTL